MKNLCSRLVFEAAANAPMTIKMDGTANAFNLGTTIKDSVLVLSGQAAISAGGVAGEAVYATDITFTTNGGAVYSAPDTQVGQVYSDGSFVNVIFAFAPPCTDDAVGALSFKILPTGTVANITDALGVRVIGLDDQSLSQGTYDGAYPDSVPNAHAIRFTKNDPTLV